MNSLNIAAPHVLSQMGPSILQEKNKIRNFIKNDYDMHVDVFDAGTVLRPRLHL